MRIRQQHSRHSKITRGKINPSQAALQAHTAEAVLFYTWEQSNRTEVSGLKSKNESTKKEFKTLSFKMDSYDEEHGVFEGYGAVFGNVDEGGDVIETGAFTKTIAEGMSSRRIKLLALHQDHNLPIGIPLELREDANGLWVKGKVSDTATGKDIKVLLKDGVLTEMSIGYDPVVFDIDESGVRHLKEVRLWEISLVTWAMNPLAVVTDYKAKEAADRANAMVAADKQEVKEGRKISSARLKALKEARDALDVLIKECEAEKESEKSGKTAQKSTTKKQRPAPSRKKSNHTIKIIY